MKVEIRRFPEAHRRALLNREVRGATFRATENFNLKRGLAYGELRALDDLKSYAAAVKDHTLANLDLYLAQLTEHIERLGGHVHFAADAQEAREIVVRIARETNCRSAVKSKSMVSEEIELNAALEAAGVRPVETDLGEYILQQEGEFPSHIIGPAIHKPKREVDELFWRLHGVPRGTSADGLARKAREVIREEFLAADMGISGVNFAVAESGSVVIVENEGNARLTTSAPRVHVAVMGIEKVIPRLSDLGVFLKLLPRAATGQRASVFVSVISGPKRPEESEGPQEFHLVVLDNGRSRILADPEMRASLRCIRCGACLNTCPVYQQLGGHAYGWVYSGPIGSVLDPNLLGLKEAGSLPYASTLCGACGDVCPVRIPLPQMLVTLRGRAVEAGLTSRGEALAMRSFAQVMTRPRIYRLASRGARFSPWRGGRLPRLNLPLLAGWQLGRDFPAPARQGFRDLWASRLQYEQAEDGRSGVTDGP
ncbi:LutB/LldF family L-lactate oxidation iron-sulfur protein [Deinococcus peraridilitoris]|uniref:(4Fe-4S) cluster-containing protein n=1 Tax=Deinococcus peraridilitoris (strain DSM 19664 / LMG 22246 / CIP 109416 / KR-200) TaxID=937777 RepID=L0A2Z3_DEIPD|nr:LutB/LldF family L-lactate oxidation iron-sulfur protein [Deinococcus peraridilitoris]AFZ68206.1 (4Fe-4S) cluster-containing protein [Deinococcus peraridilitoris DSM 19664]